jgi:hypothetical protein
MGAISAAAPGALGAVRLSPHLLPPLAYAGLDHSNPASKQYLRNLPWDFFENFVKKFQIAVWR